MRRLCSLAILLLLLCRASSEDEAILDDVKSGTHLTYARFGAPGAPRRAAPLALGLETVPLGAAFLFGHKFPDLFVANTNESEHPGLFAYEFTGIVAGAPAFRRRFRVQHPFTELLPRGAATIVQVGDVVHGFWHVSGGLFAHARYEADAQGFRGRREIRVSGLPEGAVLSLAFAPTSADAGDLLIEVLLQAPAEQSTEQLVSNGGYHDPVYNPSDSAPGHATRSGAGVWTVGVLSSEVFAARVELSGADGTAAAKRLQKAEQRMPFGHLSLAPLLLNVTGALERHVIAGSVTGMLYWLPSDGRSGLKMRVHLKSKGGGLLAHRYPRARPIVYADSTGAPHLIVGGLGPLQFHRFSDLSMDTGGVPTYHEALPVWDASGELSAGSRAVMSAADWDGDGRVDILSGTIDGRVLLLRNVGSSTKPAFMPGIPLQAAGEELRLQGGHFAIEGPAEATFGYANPVPFDWDGDGRLDLLCVGPLGEVLLYVNEGTEQAPRLGPGRQLQADGFPLRTMWQVKPGVAHFQGRTLIVLLDEADELRAYYATGSLHVRDAGALRLQRNGKSIRAHLLAGGASGQLTLNVVDFDQDGVLDLVVGAPRHASLPDADSGLPRSQGFAGSVALLMRGHVEEQGRLPRFQHPSVFMHNGSVILTGRSKGSVSTMLLGTSGPHLLVGEDSGRVTLYLRSLLSTADVPRFSSGKGGAAAEEDDPLEASTLADALRAEALLLRAAPRQAAESGDSVGGRFEEGEDAREGCSCGAAALGEESVAQSVAARAVPAFQGFSFGVGACACLACLAVCRLLLTRRASGSPGRRRAGKSFV